MHKHKQEYNRSERVSGVLQRELARLIQRDISVAELGLVTISAVTMSPDLRHAKIYITSFADTVDSQKVQQRLNEQASHWRYDLGKVLVLRYLPTLRFIYDDSVAHGSYMAALIDKVSN